ncbi:MAG: DUF4349 domain-containing protein [Acidobacteria bacterium]|nr:DUF4349 domain-containing protein [Acidobacteriota bacterium]MBS1864572.1 DUF4349 domain-containing protein [Acidobacteriota bacterium]
MLCKLLSVVCVAVILCAGCGRARMASKMSVDQARPVGFDELRQTTADYVSLRAGFGGGGSVYAAGRFVAVRHKLEVVEPGVALPKSIEAVVAFCGTIQCEVLSSTVNNETAVLSPSGNIAIRVVPQDWNKFLDFVGKQGKIAQHSTESEDKTAAVVDVEAKIKNQTEFRDSLRKMLAKPGVSVADLLQIQEKLAEAQAELDSEATQSKMLANETEKVYVEVAFRSEQRTASRSAFAPIGEALRESGGVFADSLAAFITAVAAIIPWLIVIVPGIWVLVRAIKRWRSKRSAVKVTPAA